MILNYDCIRDTCLSSYCTICGKISYRFKEDKSIVKDFTRTSVFNGKIRKYFLFDRYWHKEISVDL